MKHRITFTLVVLLVAAVAVGIWLKRRDAPPAGQPGAAKRPPPLVMVETVPRRALARGLELTGSIEPTKVARMASPAEGPILECKVREGDRVQAGDRVVRVGRSQAAESAMEAATEELKKQTAEVERVEQLVQSGAIPGEQVDAVRANLKRAEALLAAPRTGIQERVAARAAGRDLRSGQFGAALCRARNGRGANAGGVDVAGGTGCGPWSPVHGRSRARVRRTRPPDAHPHRRGPFDRRGAASARADCSSGS